MALILKFSATVADKLANTLTLKDTTGDYDVSLNPGGYGVANNFINQDIVFIKYKTWTDTAWLQTYLTGPQSTDLHASDGLTVVPSELGSSGDTFPDGVDQLQMIPLNTAGVDGTFTLGSKIVTLNPTTFDPSTYGSTLVAYIAGVDGTIHTKVYEIDQTGTNDTTQLTLKEAFDEATTTLPLWFGPIKDIKILVNKAAEACIASTLGGSSPLDCNCSNNSAQVNKMIQWRFTADVLFNCDDFVGAHNTLVQLNRICNSTLSNCAS